MVVTRSMMATSAPNPNIVLRTAEETTTRSQERTGPESDTEEDDDDEYSESGSSSTDQTADNDTALTVSTSSTTLDNASTTLDNASTTLDNASASSGRTTPTTTTATTTRPHQPRRVVLRWLRTIRSANSYRLTPIRRRVGICFLCNQIKTLTQRVEFGTNTLDCGRNCAYRIALSCPGRDRMR
jgi:hypothetical protein